MGYDKSSPNEQPPHQPLCQHASHAAAIVPRRECRLHRHDLVAHVVEALQDGLIDAPPQCLRAAAGADSCRCSLRVQGITYCEIDLMYKINLAKLLGPPPEMAALSK
jgi:hypothetical protein